MELCSTCNTILIYAFAYYSVYLGVFFDSIVGQEGVEVGHFISLYRGVVAWIDLDL